MDIWIFVILAILLTWIIFYSFYKEKWNAAADRIQSKGWRTTAKVFLKISYVLSLIGIVVTFIFQIASLFSNKGNKA